MAQKCSRCGKGSKKAANRSHAMNKTLRRQKANLQKHHGTLLCTRCLRTGSKAGRALAK